jgi:uncharacterized protein YneF (UPF0154 family)
MSSWLVLLIGFAFGGFLGLICGIFIADEYWKRKNCPFCEKKHPFIR